MPTASTVHALLCNTINKNLNLYYDCAIDCYSGVETNLCSNHIRLTTLGLTRHQFESVRRIKNWNRNMNPYVLKQFEEEDRYKVFDIIYEYPKYIN